MKNAASNPAVNDPAEQHAVERLRETSGLARVRVRPHDDSVQLVGCDGVCLGRIRLIDPHARQPRWSAVPAGAPVSLGHFPSSRAAAAALARAADLPV